MSDLISREAAIAELCNRKRLLNTQLEALDISREDAVYSICIDALRALPPAQEAAPALARESAAPAVKVKPIFDERKLHDLWTMGNCRMSFAAFKARILAAQEGGEA